MKHKPLPIDWDELEGAFENRNEDLRYYLDLITGQVVLEGEGEDAEFDDDAEIDSAVDPESPRKETTRIYVETFTVDDELDWMDEFIEGEEGISAELKDRFGELVASTGGDGFRDELRHHAEIRDRWFLFRSERLHEIMEAWLAEHQINCATPPPWK